MPSHRHTRRGRRATCLVVACLVAAAGCAELFELLDLSELDRDTAKFLLSGVPTHVCSAMLWAYLPPRPNGFPGEGNAYTPEEATEDCKELQREYPSSRVVAVDEGVSVANGTVDFLEIAGTLKGNQLPNWTAILPPVEDAGGGTSTVVVSIGVTDTEQAPASTVPKKVQATLYDVNANGKRKKVARQRGKFSKQESGVGIAFEGVDLPGDHFEVDVVVKGGKVQDGTMLYSAMARTAGLLARRPVSAASRWHFDPDARSASARPVGRWGMASVGSIGKVNAGQLPQGTIRVDIVDLLTSNARAATYDVVGLLMMTDANLDPPKRQVSKARFTLYDVDRNGKRRQVAVRTGDVARTPGMAAVVFEGIPAPADRFEVVAEAIGGSLQDAAATFSAIGTVSASSRVSRLTLPVGPLAALLRGVPARRP